MCVNKIKLKTPNKNNHLSIIYILKIALALKNFKITDDMAEKNHK